MKIFKKLLTVFLIILLLLAAFIAYHLQTNAIVTTEEIIPTAEAEQIQSLVKKTVNIVDVLKTSYASRFAHAKGHACVKAYVDVNQDIDPKLQYGVLQKVGARYKSWIRFSNSSSNMKETDDRTRDARGMAIKLLNVSENLNGGNTQEFIAHNSPIFFAASVDDFNQFLASKGDLTYFVQGYNPFKWRLRELWRLVTALSPPPKSPLWTQYFSNTAYKLGPNSIKFMMQSCGLPKNIGSEDTKDPNLLKNNLAKELTEGEACMQLMVQLQDAKKKMPIEDATILWKESDSPFLPVAKITILKQQFDTQEQQHFCENLSFSPWNALEAHRPIGALNRARKWAYEASSNYRHQLNKTTVPQSLDW
ncbi:MAG: catalase [Methylotenera sp.]